MLNEFPCSLFYNNNEFTISNGVRQGGVLSPYLFSVYVDQLSESLNAVRTGCYRVSPKIRQGLILLFFRKITPGLILGGYHLFSFIKNKIAK